MIPEEPNVFLNKYANHITDDNIIDRRKVEKELLEIPGIWQKRVKQIMIVVERYLEVG